MDIIYSLNVNISGIRMIIGIFFPNLKIIVKIKPKITDKNIISNKKTRKKILVSSKNKFHKLKKKLIKIICLI